MPVPFIPRNKAATEHRGQLDRVTFSDPDQPFCILLLADGATLLGAYSADQFARGTTYRFLGRWEDDPKRGPRFRFSTFTVHAVHNKVGVVRYLTKACEGIGEKIAGRIYEKYRSDSVKALREQPHEVAAACGIDHDLCETAARQLNDVVRFEDTRIELFGLFSARGFQADRLIERVIDKWGARAPQVIRRNPFALLGLPSAGFKRCDKMWTDFGLPKDSKKRCAIVAANLLRSDAHANTWVSADELGDRLKEMIPQADLLGAFKLALRARLIKKHREAGSSSTWLSTYRRATSEERIATALARLGAAPVIWPTDRVPVSEQEGDRLPSAHQVEQLGRATAGPVGLFLGGPGTGKTHTLAYLLREVIAQHGKSSIVVCAPTGKAAVRATQAMKLAGLDLAAATIHSTLEIGRNGHDGDGWGFQRNRDNPLDCRFLVCDETSMNDTDLMADLLDACPTGCQVLFVGDPHQLPPVGHGAPLRDMIEAKVPHGELTEVRRNAGLIVRACQQVKDGKPFTVATAVNLEAEVPQNLQLIEARDESHARELLTELMKTLKGATGFDPCWQTQVIVARNTKGEICRKKLNALLQPMLNPDGYGVEGNPFRVADKIICTRNGYLHKVFTLYDADMEQARDARSYDQERDPESNQPVEVYVANGEIGRVIAVGPKLTIARFSEGEALVKIPMGKQSTEDEDEIAGEEESGGGRGCNFDHAYAVTGHRMQGSESPCVIVMGDEQAGMIGSREWIYTALSRASKLCILIGKMPTFTKMTARRVLNRRRTFLRRRILDVRYAEL
jgi:exodeoxyribonuclease V alpha subunit